MRLCLGHPQWGYYMRGDVFGAAGDFTTSPELSQLFGELVGVWCVAACEALRLGERAGGFTLIECGPGRGTLAAAVLRVLGRFPAARGGLRGVHLVETSPALRGVQAATLGAPAPAPGGGGGPVALGGGPFAGVPVAWWDRVEDVPPGPPALLLSHELLDALPTHQLHLVAGAGAPRWRELLVDAGEDGGLAHVLARGATPASVAFSSWLAGAAGARYLQRCRAAGGAPQWPAPGDVAEVSPAAAAFSAAVGARVATQGGAALLVDYGSATGAPRMSLRGVRAHRFVHPLSAPGLVDLSVDADFCAAAEAAAGGAAAAAGGDGAVAVLGPSPQGVFLQKLGLAARVQRLVAAVGEGSPAAERLRAEATRLAHPSEMGAVYKAMAVVPAAHAAQFEPLF
jgi:NADH dehydrogenase [ubiquinone] 1 alpha subcomplex assembly factor 7